MQINEDSTERTQPQCDHSDNNIMFQLESELVATEEESVNTNINESGSAEQILVDFLDTHSSQTEINVSTIRIAHDEDDDNKDDHDILLLLPPSNDEELDTMNFEQQPSFSIEDHNIFNNNEGSSSPTASFMADNLLGGDDGVSQFVINEDSNNDATSESKVITINTFDDTISDDEQLSPARMGNVSAIVPISPPARSSSLQSLSLRGRVVAPEKQHRKVAQFMLSDATRERINEIFTGGDGKISPMWENNPWVDFLVFFTASTPKDECILMVADLLKFFNHAGSSDQKDDTTIQQQLEVVAADPLTLLLKKNNGSVDIVLRLLKDFYNHVQTKVPGRIEDESKAKEQAAIVTAVYFCVLLDYMKIASLSVGLTDASTSGSGSVDATAAFFLACMPAKERDLLLSSSSSSSSLAVEFPSAIKNKQVFCETAESSSQVASTKNNNESSSNAEHSASISSGGGMVNHVGSLLRKKLHLDSKSSKNADSTEATNKGRSISRRFSKSSSTKDTLKQKVAELPPKQPQEVAEGDDYTVYIHREMLGLTVENVLERTIIRTVLAQGAAKKSGAKVGSLIVKVGGVKTYTLTHFETIDELRRSNRPLKLDLRIISLDALKVARAEMGRLIRGGEFGRANDVKAHMEEPDTNNNNDIEITSCSDDDQLKNMSTLDEHSEAYETTTTTTTIGNSDIATSSNVQSKRGVSQLVSYRWNLPMKSVVAEMRLSKKEKAISKAGEKLVTLLTLFLIGIDYELYQNATMAGDNTSPYLGENTGKTVSKLLFEYVSKHVQVITEKNRTIERCKLGGGTGFPNIPAMISPQKSAPQQQQQQAHLHSPPSRHRSKSGKKSSKHVIQNPNTTAAGVPLMKIHALSPTEMHQSSLWQIGDVLHRATSFLGDCTLKSALVIQTQLIALLCDLLDLDSEMELSQFDEESHSYATKQDSLESGEKQKGGMQGDLGCAGSLLKLIIRNSAEAGARYGDKSEGGGVKGGNVFLAVVHRLAASRSPPARITACSLGPVIWNHLDFAHTLQLRGVITRSLHDVDVNVRRSTAAVLHETAELVFDPRSVPWLVLMCERAMSDPEPQLRAAAMTLTWHLAEHLPNAFLGDARKGSRSRSRLPERTDSTFAEVYLLQCKLLPVATRLAEDRAASVRLAVAAQCDRLCSALGDHWFVVIIDLLQALLGDSDERVRSEAVLCLPRLIENVLTGAVEKNSKRGVSVLESLLPHMLKLAKDPSSSVRAALATSSGELLTLLVGLSMVSESDIPTEGIRNMNTEFKEHLRYVDEMLIPLAQQLLNDKDVEVTSAALRAVTNASRGNAKELRSRLPGNNSTPHLQVNNSKDIDVPQSPIAGRKEHQVVVVPALSEGQIMRLLPTLTDLSSSSLWRVRQSAVEVVPALLGCTQRLETRSAIAQLCVTLMGDSVDAVRRTAAECLCLGGGSLGGNGGGEWLREIVIPIVKQCRDSELSKQRMLCLKMVEVLIRKQVCNYSETISSSSTSLLSDPEQSPLRQLLEVAASLSCDKTVNVRLNVGRVLGDIVDECSRQDNVDFIIGILEELLVSETSRVDGGDRDVLYFAKCALDRARSALNRVSSAYSMATTTPPRRRPTLAEI